MAVYAALLRGINVGGNRKVGMPALKMMFESMGFERVQTYINSGNVVFTADAAKTPETIVRQIESGIEAEFGFPVDVIVRSADDLGQIVETNPFASEGSPEELNLHVGFAREAPSAERLARLDAHVNDNDRYRLVGDDIYVMFRAGVRDSKLGAQLGKLGVPVTLRNWNTAKKLREMAETLLP